MKENGTKIIAILLVMVFIASFTGCKREKYTIDENYVYTDACASFSLPEDHFLAVDSTEEMGSAYYAYYTFKGEKDFTGSNIVYMALNFDDASMKMVDDTREDIEKSLKDQFRAKDQSVKVIDFRTLDQDGCKGYVVEYVLAEFGSEEYAEGSRIMIMAAREADRMGIIMFLSANTEELSVTYRNLAETFTVIPANAE